jgi:Mce-associated membrane protein
MSKLGKVWRHPRLPVALAVLTLLLGCLAAWSARQAHALNDSASARNTALTDNARTSELKGEVTDIINTVFSYNYTDVAKTERAAQTLLTGKAVKQYNEMIALIRKQAPQQKLVLTTTVTDSGVRMLTGDRARLLIFADQRSTRTDKNQTAYSATMFSVGAVHRNDRWQIENIDTFGSQ